MNINSRSFIFILPVALSWLFLSQNPQLILVSLLVMALAEFLRQYLSATFAIKAENPRQLFFFGVIYKDSEGMFLNRSPHALAEFPRSRKIFLLVGIYILTLSVRFSPAFAALDFIYPAFFSLIITLWVYSGTYKALGKVMLLQILGTCAAFIATPETNTAGFLFWLALSLWAQLQLHSWQLNEQSQRQADESTFNFSFPEIFKAGALVLFLLVCFRVADFFIPEYDDVLRSAPAAMQDASYSFTTKKKKPTIPKKLLQKMAKLKLQAGEVDLNKLSSQNLKIPDLGKIPAGLKLPSSSSSSSSSSFPYGENQQSLEEIKENLAGNKPLNPGDLEKLQSLTKKIETPPEGAATLEQDTKGGTAPDSQEKSIEERIEKLKSLRKDEKQIENEDDAAAYVRSRKELASEVDKLISRDQKNTLLNEELKLQIYFDKILEGIKRFSLMIALIALMAWWLSKKAAAPQESHDAKSFSLPKEVRLRLKTLYKMLLNGKFSAKEEVLKSYYIVELAFKEIEFGRDEDLPPLNFLEKLKRDMPFVAKFAETPIDLFSRVFYGDKNPDDTQILELRSSMQQLMQKLRVI